VKDYGQYCPIAHALGLVGERWSLLIVRELLHGPLRYSDLAEALPGIGTNILAARLRGLEACGVAANRRLPPPAASQADELTAYGQEPRGGTRALAPWGARSLGPPGETDLRPGWLAHALDVTVADGAPSGRIEFRVGDEVAGLVDGAVVPGPVDQPDAVVTADPDGVYRLLVDRSLDGVTTTGDRDALARLVGETPRAVAASS